MRANAADFWTKNLDLARFREAKAAVAKAAGEARARGVAPNAEEARPVVEAFVRDMAQASGGAGAEVDMKSLREQMRLKADPRAERYWQLVAIMRGQAAPSGVFDDMRWLSDAIRHHVRP
jgi:hypothetical protein